MPTLRSKDLFAMNVVLMALLLAVIISSTIIILLIEGIIPFPAFSISTGYLTMP